jgi:hypothetical protein
VHSLLIAFCQWVENTWLARSILESSWAFPYVQLTHFTGLSLWVGTNVYLDLRLMGVGKTRQTAAQLSEELFVWNWIGLCVAITGGFLLFSISAMTYVNNAAFRTKLGILIPLGIVLHILVQHKARSWGRTDKVPTIGRIAGLCEFLVWLSVITAAVLIPYFSADPS